MGKVSVGTISISRRGFCNGGFVQDKFLEGIVFTYSVDQNVVILNTSTASNPSLATGKILGKTSGGAGYYIVKLDRPTSEAKAILVHEDELRLLTCHWCQDSEWVAVTPLTGEQIKTNTIPMKPCPYCTEKAVTRG